jgi:hypothetical protein
LTPKRVLDDEKLPNVAFHLPILAIEEIGTPAGGEGSPQG